MPSAATKKVTISLPVELLSFADSRATDQRKSRSGVISDLLERERLHQLEELAREAYEHYAAEAEEFAEASAVAVASSWGELEPVPRKVKIVEKGPLRIAVPIEPGEALSEDVVNRTLRETLERAQEAARGARP